jgi:hypothetical protein
MVALTTEVLKREHFRTFLIFAPQFQKPTIKLGNETMPYLPSAEHLGRDMSKLNRARRQGRFKTRMAKDRYVIERLAQLAKKEGKTLAEKLLSKVLTERFRNFTFVVTKQNHLNFIVQALVENGLAPSNLLVKEASIMLVPFNYLSISFLPASQFVQGSFSKLRKQFNIDVPRIFFPQALSNCNNYFYSSASAPPFRQYVDLADSTEDVEEKLVFWKRIEHDPFSFVDSMQQTCLQEVFIVAKACLSLTKTSFEIQISCKKVFGQPDAITPAHTPYLHLFSHISLGSFTYDVWRLFCLKPNVLYAVMNQFGGNSARVSLGELEMTSWLQKKYPGKYRTAFSSKEGQKRLTFKKNVVIIPDAWSENELHFFHGCFWHGHECFLTKGMSEERKLERQERFKKQLEILLTTYPASSIFVTRECEWKVTRKEPEIKAFLDLQPRRPLTRLVPQDAVRGALDEAYELKWPNEEGDHSVLTASDVSSLYPSIALAESFPTGRSECIMGYELDCGEVEFSPTDMLFNRTPVYGLVHCRILPPKDFMYPFILTKINDRSVATLCFQCAKDLNGGKCKHSDFKRSFVGTYTTGKKESSKN